MLSGGQRLGIWLEAWQGASLCSFPLAFSSSVEEAQDSIKHDHFPVSATRTPEIRKWEFTEQRAQFINTHFGMKQNWACLLAPHLVTWVAPWEGYLTTLKISFCICKIRILKTIATLQRYYETVTSSCMFTRQHSSRYNARARETYVIITLCTNDNGKGECWFQFLLRLVCVGGVGSSFYHVPEMLDLS